MKTSKSPNGIELGLAVSALSLHPGQCRTHKEIAAYCWAAGRPVSWQRIHQIEQKALRKLRVALYAQKWWQEVERDGWKPS